MAGVPRRQQSNKLKEQGMIPVEKLLLKAAEVSVTLGLSRTKTYALMASGELPTLRIGRSIRVPRAALQKWIEQQTASTTNEQGQ